VLVLVLDTATPAITSALAELGEGVDVLAELGDGVDVLAERRTVNSRGHGELLAPQIAEVLQATGARPADLRAVVAGTGPGPFTGLRVGLVTAAAFGQALGIPVYGVCSLDAIGAATAGVTGPVLVATDARRREVYWAVYLNGTRRTGPAVDRPADVPVEGIRQAYGDGACLYADVLGVEVCDEPRYPPPAALAALAADRIRARAPSEPLTPLYLRRPDASYPADRGLMVPAKGGKTS
jgi:tRNA threonylcarbamoyl adenosine modification protein YeaZ